MLPTKNKVLAKSTIRKGSWLIAAALFSFCVFKVFSQSNVTIPEPSFTAPEIFTNREARLRLTVPTGTAARVDASTNMIDWSGFLTTGAGSITHTDTFAPFAATRYYRAEQLAAGAMTGDHISTTNGDIVIHPVTHASFVMTWNGITIYNDPDAATYTGLPKADLVLISHDHGDHWENPVIENNKNATVTIITSKAVTNLLTAALRPSCIVLTNGASTNVLGIQIDAVPAETRALQNIDVAFLCMNVPFTMTVQQAASVTRAFAPKVVYPYHYRNQDGTLANLNTFKSLVGTDLSIEVRFRKWY